MAQLDLPEDIFRDEASKLLGELETRLLELEKDATDKEQINGIFRALHTIKGSGAMFGFLRISTFAHEIEAVYDRIRNGQMEASRAVIDLTLNSCDHLRFLLDRAHEADGEGLRREEELTAGCRRLLAPAVPDAPPPEGAPEAPAGEAAPVGTETAGPEREADRVTYRIRLRPPANLFTSGVDMLAAFDDLRSLGPCQIVTQTDDLPQLEDLQPDHCYYYWDIVLTTSRGEAAIREALMLAAAGGNLQVAPIDDEKEAIPASEVEKVGEILVERGDLAPQEVEQIVHGQKKFGDLAVETGAVTPEKVATALLEQRVVRELRERREQAEATSSIRVAAVKVDRLVDLVGELVTVQARLSQVAARNSNIDLLAIAETVERLIAELRDNAMEIRMLPIGATFAKFTRLVRDLSGDLNKEIDLVMAGGETEVDKTVIDKLGDPLMHLVRNAVDHGIELPAEREVRGKPRRGTVRLTAEHAGAFVLIRVRDDGAGLDADAILAKAREKGLVSPQAELSERDVYKLIFLPGFSTAKNVTAVSGRGVGMDVVKQNIESLRGSVEINSWRGQGSEILLKLPLTLAIIDGLLVRLGSDSYIIPLALVEECLALTQDDTARMGHRHIIQVRGEIVPYVRLAEHFAMEYPRPAIEQIVVCRVDNKRLGLAVDKVVGQYQTVIKPLSRFYKNVRGLSGASILGDGTVALIMDVAQLARIAEAEELSEIDQVQASVRTEGGSARKSRGSAGNDHGI